MLRWIRRLAWGAVAVLGFLAAAVSAGWLVTDGPLGERRIATGPASLQIGGPFTLTDHRGREVTERDFRGRPMAVFFGFTHCPDVCPTALADMTRFMEDLGPGADRIHWVFVSVDSERDTPSVMTDYLSAFDPRIVGLSGTEAQIADTARAFRVYYQKVTLEGGGYTMDHSASVFLLDGEGRFAGTLDRDESEHVALQKLRMLASR